MKPSGHSSVILPSITAAVSSSTTRPITTAKQQLLPCLMQSGLTPRFSSGGRDNCNPLQVQRQQRFFFSSSWPAVRGAAATPTRLDRYSGSQQHLQQLRPYSLSSPTFAIASSLSPSPASTTFQPTAPASSTSAFTPSLGGDNSRRDADDIETQPNSPPKASGRAYHWVSVEAEKLIARSYQRHKALADHDVSAVPKYSPEALEKLEQTFHFEPRDWVDRLALRSMRFMRIFTHMFFREKYDHHAVVLETVAAVPGIVASAARHLRSLRRMQRDNGWINPLQEEAENERMHLLIWMQVTQPTLLERALVIAAQGVYLHFYIALYLLSPRGAHRFVGYLEEEAHLAYTDFLHAIDRGDIANGPAPDIAKKYYHLPEDARIRDVVLHVRADECMHRDFNHMLSDQLLSGVESSPQFMSGDSGDERKKYSPADENEYRHAL